MTAAWSMAAVLSCRSVTTNRFSNGSYTGAAGQTLSVSGDEFAYTASGTVLAGSYVIDGGSVVFSISRVNGQPTGRSHRTIFEFVSTPNSIALSDRDEMECGMDSSDCDMDDDMGGNMHGMMGGMHDMDCDIDSADCDMQDMDDSGRGMAPGTYSR